ncbi:MAG: cytochrome c family protein [Pirellulaceae bacterium]
MSGSIRSVIFLASFLICWTCCETTCHSEVNSELANDPHKVVGAENCSKCHQNELNVWKQTPHFHTFDTLHRKPEAQQIAERMGIRSIKRDETCMQCHYTAQQDGSRSKLISGVSCESCHGAAKDWLTIHNDYGGPDVTKEMESDAHRRKRRLTSMKNGMRNPTNLYLVARSCLNCHTTPMEKLVNVGGHPAGSQSFELVSWSQGMVRHNFVRSNGTTNNTSDSARLRQMFVVGVMADLEYSLRATAQATEKAKFGIANAERANRARLLLLSLQERLNDPHIQQALDAIKVVRLTPNNREVLEQVADQVGSAAFIFAQKSDGATLAAIDDLIPPPSQYK